MADSVKGAATGSIHVAVAAISNSQGQVLISKRPAHVHQGGLWEFPGGKLEAGESVLAGLERELSEELGILPVRAQPLIRIHHEYPDKAVLLDVWRVEEISGEPFGREGQEVRWVTPEALSGYPLPAANRPVVTAMKLPSHYPITPEPGSDTPAFLAALDQTLARGYGLLQLRARQLPMAGYRRLVPEVLQRCRLTGTRLLLNADPGLVEELGAAGVHLGSERLMALSARPLDEHYLVAASCHNRAQLQHAVELGLDFVVVSPVQQTASHPDARPLGFSGLRALTEQATLPVYALGGMRREHLEPALQQGAQGIAAISGLWGAVG